MNKLFAIAIAVAVLALEGEVAQAGLIGMPMNLLAAVRHVGVEKPVEAPALRNLDGEEFCTDDVWAGPVPVETC